MHGNERVDRSSLTAEQASVASTTAYLLHELQALEPASSAAQLYEAFIAALDKVYGAQASA